MRPLWIIMFTLALGLRSAAMGVKQGRIVGGAEAADGEFPHQVLLLRNKALVGDVCLVGAGSVLLLLNKGLVGDVHLFAAGSVLTSDWILTCGHCVMIPQSEMIIVSGTNSVSEGGFLHSAQKLIPHEGYIDKPPYPNDIALIKVFPPLIIDGIKVAPVKLPARGQFTPDGTVATVIGWGVTWEGGDCTDKLQKVDIFVVNHDYCNDAYDPPISDRQICAGVPEGGKGNCYGDSGGPLLVNGEVIGIVSWGAGCARKGYPSVYTNVAAYIDWIDDNMS